MEHLRYRSPAADLAARTLKLLSRYRTSCLTLAEIAAELQVPKTSCLRVLRTLQAHGLLGYDEAGQRYSLGEYAVVIGSRAAEGLDPLTRVRPLLAAASRATGLTAAFVQRVAGDRMMYVAKHEHPGGGGVSVSVGNRFPVTSVSYGKWVMAFAHDEERERLLAAGLPRITAATTTERAQYLRQVDALRVGEILESRAEYVHGIYAVSCALVDARHELAGVLVVLGVLAELDDDRRRAVCAVMREIATRCTAQQCAAATAPDRKAG
ncbi:IclR family transcriptional regulator [Pseudonocardia kunmingensis]|uniref:IclR family transcriptional regulator n=1 Tax=Pseudonocardia kunmingensis TaxID=630975 RepID=A0A543DLB4_9PSEU|nr:IclR family transcriptional regulator C-terminal domain-containing protein [Pseudonocardia kunmingensis]TQM10101.1 IclR family transcriptional regulator [Pseudonocardia kunmingensis]